MKKITVFLILFFCLNLSLSNIMASDLSVLLANSQIKRDNQLIGWKYYNGFFMYSLFRIYERTSQKEYLSYIKNWADASMSMYTENEKSFKSLDDMYPALVLLELYEKTGDQKYMELPQRVISQLKNYPRTKNGAFIHMQKHDGQVWLDGMYMINVFLAKYASITGNMKYFDEAINQICHYTELLKDKKTGLLFHAYADNKPVQYFDSITKHSSEFWGRSIGWVMMASVEVYDMLPDGYKGKDKIAQIIRSLSRSLIKYQDANTGLWYQVIDKPQENRNWLESSASAMFAYGFAKGVNLDILDNSYKDYAIKAFNGLLKYKVFLDEDGLYTVKDICHGTEVGDLDYYLNRPHSDNNLRGFPAVVLMSEELKDIPYTIQNISGEDIKRRLIDKESLKSGRYFVTDYGIIGDGKYMNTHRIQSVIELAHKNGGGTIYFPSGKYLTGAITLKEHVYLELSSNATIVGSSDISDYPSCISLINAYNSNNIGIMGDGTIDGSGSAFWKNKINSFKHPEKLIKFEKCQNIKIYGVHLINAPFWNIHLLNCDYAWINGVTLTSDPNAPNTDGIDPSSSSHIYITNCYFDLGDDAICPKTVGDKPTEYIVVDNCIIKSDDAAIKLGTSSHAPMRHMVFNNIIIKDSQYGITFFGKDGGTYEDIRFSNIIIESCIKENIKEDRPVGNYPIFMDLEKRNSKSKLGCINNIHFSNITINSENGHCLFLGQPDSPIRNITFSNIQFNIKKHVSFDDFLKPRGNKNLVDKASNDYSNIPSHFTFAFANNIIFNDIIINDYDKENKIEKHLFWVYKINALQIKNFTFNQDCHNKKLAQFALVNSSDISISNGKPAFSECPLIWLEGSDTNNIRLFNNDLRNIPIIKQSDNCFDNSEFFESNNML